VHDTIGAHHNRVMRLLRNQGFLQEKDITRMSVLPNKNVNSVLNKLLHDGLIEYQEMGNLPGQSGGSLMFGVNYTHVNERIGLNACQAALNILRCFGKLGRHANLMCEVNNLLLY
jgi:hypothetical protein